MKLIILLVACASICEATLYGQMLKIYRSAIDSRKTSRDLAKCWNDPTGNCCRTNVSGCRNYRRHTKTRANYFFINTVPFKPGNFPFMGCNVQCLCNSPQPSCSGGPSPPFNPPAPYQPPAPYNPPAPYQPPVTQAPATAAPATAATAAPATQAPAATQAPGTAAPATAASATAAPTTAAQTSSTAFCPAEATTQPTSKRILGGTSLNDCTTYPGIVSIVDTTDQRTVCTGVVTSSLTIDMPSNCAQLLTVEHDIREPTTGELIDTLPVIDTSTVPTGGPFTITLASALSTNSCPGIACVYDPAMVDVIDLESCVAVGSGYTSASGSGDPSLSYMNVPTLEPTSDCPSLISSTNQSALFDTSLTYNCFYGGQSSTCAGDVGAPVMCPLATGEIVVIGQTENIPCQGTEIVGFFNLEAASRVLRIDPLRFNIEKINNRKVDVRLGGFNSGRGSETRLKLKDESEEIGPTF